MKITFLIKPQKCFWKALSSNYKLFLGAVSLCQWGNSCHGFYSPGHGYWGDAAWVLTFHRFWGMSGSTINYVLGKDRI